MAKPNFQIVSDTELYTNELTPLQVVALSSAEYSSNYYLWNFGDGGRASGSSAEYVYTKPGDYEITLTQYLSSGEPVTSDSQSVTVRNLIPNLMEWDTNSFSGNSITASVKGDEPFIANVYNSWQQFDENSFLHLYVENSKSIPFDITDKRIHLKPNWRFLDEDDNVIERIVLDQKKIYASLLDGEIYLSTDSGDVFVGLSSQAKFQFIDDTPSGINPGENYLPSTIIVTQNLSSIYGDSKFSNEDYLQYPSLIQSVFVDNIVPDRLEITSNGVFDIDNTKYINTKIPYNIRLVDESGNYIKTNPVESNIVTSYDMNIGFVGDNITIDGETSFDGNTLKRFKTDFSNLGGFFESYFIPQNTTPSIQLSASTLLDYTINETLTRFGSFSDENSNKIYQVSFVEGFGRSYKRKDALAIEPITISDNNYSNIFGLAVDGFYNTIFLDSDASRVELYDVNFNYEKHYELSSYDTYVLSSDGLSSYRGHPSPAQICLNNRNEYFITLHDSADLVYIKDNNVQKIDLYSQILSGGDFVYTPTAVEIASDNETLFISYTSDIDNFVQIYGVNYFGNEITLSSLSSISMGDIQPLDIISDRLGDNIYMLCVDYYTQESYIRAYGINGNLIYDKFIGYGAEFITIDNNQTPWTIAKSLSSENLSGGQYYYAYNIPNSPLSSNSTEMILDFDDKMITYTGGIAGDSYGNIWILDSSNDRVIIFKKDDPSDYVIQEIPEDNTNDKNLYVAYGDWNGFRWYNKFGYGSTVITYELSGISVPFTIHSRDEYNLQKVNEDFNMTETIKSYRTTDLMLNYENLFDNFLGSIYGNNLDDGTYIGRNFYEKIANFVLNHGDIETCSIDALASFCEETGIKFEDRLSFPRDIKRIVDLFSVKFKKLWGDDYKTGIIEDYKGDEIDISTYMLSADPQIQIIAKEKFNNFYSIVTPMILDTITYPLSSYEQSWGWGLSVPSGSYVGDYYDFYTISPINTSRIQGIIDWQNSLTDTEIQPLSSYNTYMTDGGIVSTILGDKLRQGLNLFV